MNTVRPQTQQHSFRHNCTGHNLRSLNLFCNGEVANNAAMRTETLNQLLDTAVRRLPLPCDHDLRTEQRQQQTVVRLRDGGVWSACSAKAGVRVRCASGTLWVTHP